MDALWAWEKTIVTGLFMEQKPNKEDTLQILCHLKHRKHLEYNNSRFQPKAEEETSQETESYLCQQRTTKNSTISTISIVQPNGLTLR